MCKIIAHTSEKVRGLIMSLRETSVRYPEIRRLLTTGPLQARLPTPAASGQLQRLKYIFGAVGILFQKLMDALEGPVAS